MRSSVKFASVSILLVLHGIADMLIVAVTWAAVLTAYLLGWSERSRKERWQTIRSTMKRKKKS